MLEQVCGCGNVCDLCDEIDPSRNYMRLWRIAASCARAPPPFPYPSHEKNACLRMHFPMNTTR